MAEEGRTANRPRAPLPRQLGVEKREARNNPNKALPGKKRLEREKAAADAAAKVAAAAAKAAEDAAAAAAAAAAAPAAEA